MANSEITVGSTVTVTDLHSPLMLVASIENDSARCIWFISDQFQEAYIPVSLLSSHELINSDIA